MNRINIFRNKSSKSIILGSFLLGSFAFSHLQATGDNKYLLHQAVETAGVEEVRQLLNKSHNPNVADLCGNVPLHYVKNPAMVSLLREKGANVNAQNNNGDTPLHSAVFAFAKSPDEMLECIKALLENGADLNMANEQGYTPVRIVGRAINEKEVYNGWLEGVKIDDDMSESYKKVCELFWFPPLHKAVFNNNEEDVCQLLAKGCNPNMADSSRNVPLHCVEDPEMVALLCGKGANVNARNEDGDTPLHAALYGAVSDPGNQEYIECIKALLANGANPIIVNKIGVTSVSIAQNVVDGNEINKGSGDVVVVDAGAQAAFGGILAQLKAVIDPLHYAVMTGNEHEVKRLLDEKPNPNLIDRFGNAPLHYVRIPEMVTLLRERGANINQQNIYGDTPLHSAVYWFSVWPGEMLECIKALLENGADPDMENEKSDTPRIMVDRAVKDDIVYNGQFSFGDASDVSDDYKAVRKLFRHPPLHKAVKNNKLNKVRRLLEKGYNPNLKNKKGNAPLHYAKTPEMVALLCEKGADVNLQNMYYNTPLHVAVFAVAESEDMFECIKVLLEHGADINIENRQCYTPEAMVDQVINEKTIWNDQSEVVKIDDADVINRYEAIRDLFRSPPLHDAVFSGNEKEVNRLLAQGCNPNMINALGNVSLYYAKTPEMVTILCKNGANVNLQNMYGDTPLHDALYRAVSDPGNQEYIECIKALLANNANPSIANEKGDTSVLVAQKVVGGSTIYKGDGTKAAFGEILAQLKAVINPLHYAVMINDELEVKRLLDAKNDPNLKNKFSDTPLHYAKTPGMITLLCENGADVNLQNDAGETPLHIALYGAVSDPGNQKYIECIKALLAKGADPRIANKKSNTSVLVAQKVVGESTIYKGDGTLLRVKHGAQAAFGEILELLSHPTKNASGTSSVPSTAVFGDGASFQTPTKNESGTSSVPSTAAFHKGRTFFQTPTKNESGTSSVPSTAAFHKRRTFFQAPTPKHSGKSRARQTPAQKQSGTSSVRSAAVDGDRTFFQSPTQKQSRTSAARNAAMDGDRTFFQSPTQRQSRTSAARSAAVDGDRTFFQSPTQKYGRTSSARSAAVDGDRAFLQSPTQKYGRTSSARSAAVDGDRAFLQTPTQKHSVKSRTRQTPAPKKSGTNSVPRTAVFSDRPVSRLLNRSANSEEISKPGTSLRDTTAPRALPRWNPTRSMGRNVRVSRGKSLAAGVYKNRYRRRKNQRIVLPVQKRAVPTVSTVNHSGDYGL